MLEEILDYIHNYFEASVWRGNIDISSNSLSEFIELKEGQYFKIVGSVFNDGVYQYPCSNLQDESFSGAVYGLAIPIRLLRIVEEIEEWQKQYGDKVNSPYQSESFGGYSYTKANGGTSANGSSNEISWKTVFGKQLNHWRKIA